MINYPDDCPGKECPWDEPEQPECPQCIGRMTLEGTILVCDDDDCGFVIDVWGEEDFG
tara:strand:+ start:1896 stop:2069 length:174 start_codon:yes stop_codon:yes gene_type:complete